MSNKLHSEISFKIIIYFPLEWLKDSFLGKYIVFHIFCLSILDCSLFKMNNTLPIQESRDWRWKVPVRSYSLSTSKIRIASCSTCFWDVAQRPFLPLSVPARFSTSLQHLSLEEHHGLPGNFSQLQFNYATLPLKYEQLGKSLFCKLWGGYHCLSL